MTATVVLTGVIELEAKLARAMVVAIPALGAALYVEGHELLGEALPLTPIDTGNLRASGRVEGPTVAGLGVEVQVGFGGAAADYAIYVHEDMDASHAAPTQAKFLEQPALERASGMAGRLAAKVGPAIAGA